MGSTMNVVLASMKTLILNIATGALGYPDALNNNLPASVGDARDTGSILWSRKWQPTPVILPGKSHWQRSLLGCSPQGHNQSNTTQYTHTHSIFKGIFFSEWQVSIVCLKHVVTECKQIYCHPGFVVPFIKHRQSRFSIILKGSSIFKMVNGYWLQLQVTSCTVPHKRGSLFCVAMKPGIDFSFPAVELLDGIFF